MAFFKCDKKILRSQNIKKDMVALYIIFYFYAKPSNILMTLAVNISTIPVTA